MSYPRFQDSALGETPVLKKQTNSNIKKARKKPRTNFEIVEIILEPIPT